VNRALRILLASAAVLLSGTVAFGVAAAITPPGVDDVDVVVTDRSVLSVAAAAEPIPASVAPVAGVTARADKPAAGAPSVQNKTVVIGVVSGSGPKSIVVPAVKPKPPTGSVNNDSDDDSDSDSDHEVVTPPVRDEDDDDHDDEDDHQNGSSSSSDDHDKKPSRDTTRHSGVKGD